MFLCFTQGKVRDSKKGVWEEKAFLGTWPPKEASLLIKWEINPLPSEKLISNAIN